MIVIDAVERRSQVGVQRPRALAGLSPCGHEGGLHRVLAAAARPESVRPGFEPGLPLRLQRADRQGLKRPVGDHGNPEPAPFPVCLRDEHPLDRPGLPRSRAVLQPGGHIGLLPARQHDPPVNPGRLAASIDLRHPPHAHQRVRAGPEHQLLQVADLLQVPRLTRREDPLPQPPYVCSQPGDQSTASQSTSIALRSVHPRCPTCPSVPASPFTRSSTGSPDPRQLPFGPGTCPYPASYPRAIRRRCRNLVPLSAAFRLPAFASWAILRPLGNPALLTVGLPAAGPPDPNGVAVLRISKTRPGRVPP